VDFTPSKCDEEADVYRLRTRIINKWFEGDTLMIEIGTKATCCVDFIPNINYKNDTLVLSFEEIGDPCECICCYQFIYHIVGLNTQAFGIKLQNEEIQLSNEKYLTYPEKFEIINDDTVNYIDKYGLKQGFWINKNDTTASYWKGFAENNHWKYQESISYYDSLHVKAININHNYKSSVVTHFNDSGLITSHFIDNPNFDQRIQFYPNGALKKIRIVGSDQYFYDKEYYKNGYLHIETFPENKENLYQKFYYDSGELMALYYIIKAEDFSIPEYKWICYDKNGNRIEKEILKEQGLLDK